MTVDRGDPQTLWRVSAWERMRQQTGTSGFAALGGPSVLPTTLMSDLAKLGARRREGSALEVVASCVRHRESALLLCQHQSLVWPVTLYPQVGLYHVPRPMIESLVAHPQDLQVLSVEPPGLKPPGHAQWDRVGEPEHYRALPALLWAVALHAPAPDLLPDIAGRAAYRVTADFVLGELPVSGALVPALQRLRREISSLDEIAGWPGMTPGRALRLLNAVYLQGGLMVLRTHHAAREGSTERGGLLGWMRRKR
jgi:hypothetical protein